MSELYFIENYQDLLLQIDIHQEILDNALTEWGYYKKQMAPKGSKSPKLDGMPHGNYSPISLDRAAENIERCNVTIKRERGILAELRKTKKQLDEKINSLTGLYFQVARKKYIEKNKDGSRKTLQQIADELGYSEQYIKEISAAIEKEA